MVGRRLLSVEENLRKKREKRFGGLKAFYRDGSIAFKSEIETVALTVDRDGHASIRPGQPTGETLLLEGPHEAFVEMFSKREGVGPLPYSVQVKIVGLSAHDGTVELATLKHDKTFELVIRDAAEMVLKGFFG